jgi:hypothetical protein
MAASWRGGDGLNVALDDGRGVWYDFTTGEGGGILDLVSRIRGGSRQDALKWLADFAGVPLFEQSLSAEERAQLAEERQRRERDLSEARYWRRSAISMYEETLARMKTTFFTPGQEAVTVADLQGATVALAMLRSTGDDLLLAEFRWWIEHYPGMTAALIRSAKQLEAAEMRAITKYLRQSDNGRRTA